MYNVWQMMIHPLMVNFDKSVENKLNRETFGDNTRGEMLLCHVIESYQFYNKIFTQFTV